MMKPRTFFAVALISFIFIVSGCDQPVPVPKDSGPQQAPTNGQPTPTGQQPATETPSAPPADPFTPGGVSTQPAGGMTDVSVRPDFAPQPFVPQPLNICSFNIQFLGNPKSRDNQALALLVAGFDIVVIQELVAPPYPGTFPDGTPYNPDPEAAQFFDAMREFGFNFIMSEEDTGSGDNLHINSSSTEWWVVFFRENKVQVARDLPGGYLAADRSNNDDYERVPYAFPFRTTDGSCDFVLISVHLQPDQGPSYRARRKHELATIASWIDANDQFEQDFIILGDMNIEGPEELADTTPAGFLSLNDECRPTNTKHDRPYDHVMFRPEFTREIDPQVDMQVINLAEAMKQTWNRPEPYPGDPYDHNAFRAVYSDHDPVWFRMYTQRQDDDQFVALLP